MDYRILGSVEVRDGGEALPLAGAKQRALLALLLLHANRVLSRDRLIDELWGDEPPATAIPSLHGHLSRLRKLLPPETLLTRPPGTCSRSTPRSLTCAASNGYSPKATQRSRKGMPNARPASCTRRSPSGEARRWRSSRSSRSRRQRSGVSKIYASRRSKNGSKPIWRSAAMPT
jgi:hypothetical protein